MYMELYLVYFGGMDAVSLALITARYLKQEKLDC